jgi:AraC-like DNA-binding protein
VPVLIAPLLDFAGFALGLLLAALLWSGTRGNRAANRWLAVYVTLLALLSLGDLIDDARWTLTWPHLAHLTDWMIFLVGPTLLLYVRRLTMRADPSARQFGWHAVPAVLCLLLLTGFYFQSAAIKQTQVTAELSRAPVLDPVLLIAAGQVLAYWSACLRTLRRFQRELRQRFAAVSHRNFTWLRWLLGVNLGMWVLWVFGLLGRQDWVVWFDRIAIPAGLYLLAFFGARQIDVFVGRDAWVTLPPVGAPAPQANKPDAARYQRSGLDPARMPELRQQLETLMAVEKPWLENDLTLTELASRAQLTPHHLSQLLNESLGVSFFDFVNARRVQEVKRCLKDMAYAGQTILEIALASGFNSKAAFNAVFKQHTGVTPTAFRREPAGPAS